MNPASHVTPKLVNYCKPLKSIVICGFTKTGKYTIAKKLTEELKMTLIVSDDYGFEKYEEFVSDVLNLYNQKIPFVVEGVLCFRLLRRGIEENIFHPDLVMRTICDETTIRHFYDVDGENHKANRAISFNKSLETIWNDYTNSMNFNPWTKKPDYLEFNTSL